MSRGIFIAGNASAFLAAIETEAAKREEQYALALIRNRFSGWNEKPGREAAPEVSAAVSQIPQENACIGLDWNPGSPVSARTLVIAAENRLGCIGEAILVCNPTSAPCAAADLGLADVEVLVNDHIKGWFFLIKELTAVFRTRGEGTRALVYPEPASGKATDLLGPAALAAFRSLTAGLLASAAGEPYLTFGFAGGETGDEANYAAYVFKQLDEGNRRANGKLFKYGKLGIFR
jgi:hypothetical protein